MIHRVLTHVLQVSIALTLEPRLPLSVLLLTLLTLDTLEENKVAVYVLEPIQQMPPSVQLIADTTARIKLILISAR